MHRQTRPSVFRKSVSNSMNSNEKGKHCENELRTATTVS
jgi:hypothetical protein